MVIRVLVFCGYLHISRSKRTWGALIKTHHQFLLWICIHCILPCTSQQMWSLPKLRTGTQSFVNDIYCYVSALGSVCYRHWKTLKISPLPPPSTLFYTSSPDKCPNSYLHLWTKAVIVLCRYSMCWSPHWKLCTWWRGGWDSCYPQRSFLWLHSCHWEHSN